jgi:hypothetical protein
MTDVLNKKPQEPGDGIFKTRFGESKNNLEKNKK